MPNLRTASPDFFSWVRTRRLLTRSRLVWLRTKQMYAVRKLSVWYKLPISNTVYPKTIDAFPISCVAWQFCREQSPRGFSALARLYLLCASNQNRHATQATFPKIQAWTYNRYSRSQPRKRRMKSEFTFFRSLSWLFLLAYFVKCCKWTWKVNSHFFIPYRDYSNSLTLSNAASEHEKWIHIFSFPIVIIPTRLLCQMQVNSSGAELLSTTSKFIKRKKILSLLVPSFTSLSLQ